MHKNRSCLARNIVFQKSQQRKYFVVCGIASVLSVAVSITPLITVGCVVDVKAELPS